MECANDTELNEDINEDNNSTSPFTPDFNLSRVDQTYPFDVVDIEKDYDYKDWEFVQTPSHDEDVGFSQWQNKKKDEKTKE